MIRSRLVAAVLARISFVEIFSFHHNFADRKQAPRFIKDFATAGAPLWPVTAGGWIPQLRYTPSTVGVTKNLIDSGVSR